jgi:pectin methylesterase-like acyl-CoA thioesterase
MITKLQVLIITIFLSVSSIQAQITDVWDFGATQLDTNLYNNILNETAINSWYDSSITPGSTAINLPVSFTSGVLSWVGNSGDRLRTSNTALTRFDTNIASVTTHNGRVYCNGTPNISSGVPTNRFLRMTLNEDDEVTIVSRTDAGGSLIFVDEANPSAQTDLLAPTFASGSTSDIKFVAKNTGTFKIYSDGKASFYRIYRKDAVYTSVIGAIDISQAGGIPSNYSIVFTNTAGKSWTAQINSGSYSVSLPVGYTYTLSLVDANGYIISSGANVDTTGVSTPTFNHDITIVGVTLFTVTGTINGLGTSISNLNLNYIPDASNNAIYVPEPVVNSSNSTYTVQLEPNIQYTIQANGVNDYDLTTNTITIPAANTASDLAFTPKPVYAVTINTTGLTTTQENSLQLTFTNLNESGYVYNFSSISGITLRNGTYSVTASGLSNYPVQLALTSNLVVNNAATSKTLNFVPVTVWPFNDQVITTANSSYKGLLFTGNISNSVSQGHLIGQSGATIQVPVNAGDKVKFTYYYSANFSIEGGVTNTTVNSTGTTSTTDYVEYTYAGSSAGFVNVAVGGTTYFTQIEIGGSIPYSPVITVGVDKDYQTINAALTAVGNMIRTNTDRVTIMIDPGNYEEMLSINQPLVTLKNAATTPSTALTNAGVDIDANAVRITSYYGHGYTYYSMSSDQKWHADVLSVNIANDYPSYQNVGAGTTNNSYWNATVVVGADGFEAEGIIFENSFNQYISNKEAQDIVVAWSSGSPGVRPTNAGNTIVQNKTFVERAAAIAIKNNVQKVILNKCRVVGRQDSFFGGTGARVAVYKGDMMGAVDYIFGGMDVVFYKSNLSMNISDASNDLSYITAAQQTSGRGYLMYECTITSAEPLVETASTYRAKPGYFGRPWAATTSEVVFYNTTIETSNAPGFIGNSLIMPLGWLNTLNGTSSGMYEYGTTEVSGVNNTPNRATWATSLTNPILNDGTPISTFNFTKGNDDWDPFPELIASDPLGTTVFQPQTSVNVYSYKDTIAISNVKSKTSVYVYSIIGSLVKSFETTSDATFNMNTGIWIVLVKSVEGKKSFKIVTY